MDRRCFSLRRYLTRQEVNLIKFKSLLFLFYKILLCKRNGKKKNRFRKYIYRYNFNEIRDKL